ncbi:hypothetical protein [Octadecabacter sp. R77987]|uniref:hypothetical protein n=1 Tax=Octadecabacter sp. R77987 TaxID=3093874 RepID=UPI00366BD2DB
MTAGYSRTPLWQKLGVKDGMTACVINPPEGYHDTLLAGAPLALWGDPRPDCTMTHLFTTERDELARVLAATRDSMARDGMIWASWPKKAAKVPTDVTEDVIRDVCLPMGLVDVKVCAVDATWSALKLVIRKALR